MCKYFHIIIFLSYLVKVFLSPGVGSVCSQMDPLELLLRMNVEIFSYFVKGGIRLVRPMNIWKSLQTNQNPVCEYKSREAQNDEKTDCIALITQVEYLVSLCSHQICLLIREFKLAEPDPVQDDR